MSANSQDLVMKIKTEPVEIKSEPEEAAASSSHEPTRDVKIDPEMQRLLCLNNDGIKKEPLGRTCKKCGRITMVKNHKCQIRCKICDKKLSSKGYMIRHMQSAHRAEPDCDYFECDFCGLRVLTKDGLITHLKLKHKGGKIEEFHCDYDGKIYSSKARLYHHMKESHRAAAKCKICGKEDKRIQRHMRLFHPAEKNTFACKICNKTYKNYEALGHHLKIHNKHFECRVCDRKFATAFQLKAHSKIHENPRAFQCKICYKSFNSSSYLWKHNKTHDQNRKKTRQCEHCDYATDTTQGLQKHFKIHHDKNRIKGLKCTKCDYATDNKGLFKKHINTHNPHREKFPCPQCDYTATIGYSLTFHMRIHLSNRVKDQKCPHCDFVTDYKGNLLKHIKTHDKVRVKNFKCPNCEKSFYNNNLLRSHVDTHSENRVMFPCSQCSYKAFKKDHLKNHIARIHNKKE
jgi:hypothetical protein